MELEDKLILKPEFADKLCVKNLADTPIGMLWVNNLRTFLEGCWGPVLHCGGLKWGRVQWPNAQAVPTAGVGVSVEAGWRVKDTAGRDDIATLALGSSAVFALGLVMV